MCPGNFEFGDIGGKAPKRYEACELGISKKTGNYTATNILDLMKKMLRYTDARRAHKQFWNELLPILKNPQTTQILINILSGKIAIAQFYIDATGSSACTFHQLAAWMLVEKYLFKSNIDKNELKELFIAILNNPQTELPLKKNMIYELGVLCNTTDNDVISALKDITDVKLSEFTEDALDNIKKTEKYQEKENFHRAILTLYLF